MFRYKALYGLQHPKDLVQKLEVDFSRPLMTGAIYVFENMTLEQYCNRIWDYFAEQDDIPSKEPLDLFVVHVCRLAFTHLFESNISLIFFFTSHQIPCP